MKQVQTADSRNRYDAANSLLDYLGGVQSAFAANERARKRAELEASGKVIEGYDPPPNPPAVVPPPPPPPVTRPERESGGPPLPAPSPKRVTKNKPYKKPGWRPF
jgi:hypothetical protein